MTTLDVQGRGFEQKRTKGEKLTKLTELRLGREEGVLSNSETGEGQVHRTLGVEPPEPPHWVYLSSIPPWVYLIHTPMYSLVSTAPLLHLREREEALGSRKEVYPG